MVDNEQVLVYIVAIAVIAFMLYIWYTRTHNSQPNYHVHFTEPSNKHPKVEHYVPIPQLNTESIMIGSHNSAHSTNIIASPYNPPKF